MLSCCLGTSFWYPILFRSKDTLKHCRLTLSSSEEVVMGTAPSSVWNYLGKEVQSHTFPQSLVWHLSFFFLLLQWLNPGLICHTWKERIFRTSSQALQLSPQLPMWFLQLMNSGHIANTIAMAGNSAPTSLKTLRCFRSPSSSLPLLKRACVTACKESIVQETSRLALAVHIHHTSFTMRS